MLKNQPENVVPKSLLRAARACLLFTVVLGAAACANQPVNNAAPTNTATTTTTSTTTNTPAANTNNAPVSSPSPVSSKASETNAAPLTLPVLDAFFADESFSSELKTKLQLTDGQVKQLRELARGETAKLRESNTGDYGGTTSAARTLAGDKIKAVIGEDKTRQLAQLVRERWNGQESAGEKERPAATNTAQGKGSSTVPTDTRVVVNAPAYRMDVFENGKLVKSYKVGIGYPEVPLPVGNRTARQIIFNPPWTPPDSPWVEASNHVKPGQQIEPGSKLNPLGLLKIPIGLPSLIHGGKSPARIGGFASHGCVGLTDAQVREFAKVLAQAAGTQLTDDDINGFARNRKETKTVNLKSPVAVELRYETIVVEDGKLHIYRDVYDRDTNTEENLKSVLSSYGVSLDQLSEQERAQVTDALREMSRDARGNLGRPNEKGSAKNGNQKDAKKPDAEGGKVTRTVKGRKEVVIEIAALQGKGYPAPVNQNTGGAPQPKQTSPSAGGQQRKRA